MQNQDLAKRTSELAEKTTEVKELQGLMNAPKGGEDQVRFASPGKKQCPTFFGYTTRSECECYQQAEVIEDLHQKLRDKSDELRELKREKDEQFDSINKLLQEHEDNMNAVSLGRSSVSHQWQRFGKMKLRLMFNVTPLSPSCD